MAIVKMKKLSLLVSRADRENILRELMLLGCVEISEPDELLEDPDLSQLVSRENAGLDNYRAQQTSLARGLEVLSRYVPYKTNFLAIKPEITGDLLLDEKDSATCLELAKALDTLDNRINKIISDENNERNLIESLTPWKALSLPLNSEGTGTCNVILGAVAATFDFDALQNELHAAAPEAEAFLVSSGAELHYLCIICMKSAQPAVAEVLRRYNFSQTAHKNMQGTAEENIKKAETRLRGLGDEKSDISAQITAAAEYRDTLQLCSDHIGTKIARAEAAEKLLGTDYSLALTGWATAPSEPELYMVLSKYACAWELSDPSPEEYANVPVLLKNNPATRPLSMVTEMYSLPAYGSVDPNPPMMPFFVLFYGLMMADMGYGLIMLIAAILVKRRKPTGGTKTFFDLLFLCGISTFVIGALTGGLFGDAPAQIAGLFGATFSMPYKPLFDPLNDTVMVLIGAFALGAIHIIFGMGISFVKQVKDGHAIDAVLDIGSWWILFAGIALGALGISWWVAIVGVAMIVLTGGRKSKNIFGKIGGGIGKLYDITGYFGDILSYSRVMALMLAGGVIAQVFNTLGALTGNVVTFIIIFAAGHALNFGLNLLGCYVHDMRLQCLEFFGKFYEDGGRPFSPLSVKTKYNRFVGNAVRERVK